MDKITMHSDGPDPMIEKPSDPTLDGCTFAGGNEPCPTCPRRITALHRCGILLDELHVTSQIASATPTDLLELARYHERQAAECYRKIGGAS